MSMRYGMLLLAAMVLSVPLTGAQESKSSSTKEKGYLGVQIQDISRKIEKRFKAPGDEGAYVAEVVEDGPAEKSGVKEDDIILSFGGKAVYDAEDLTRFVQRTKPDSRVDVVVWRDGAKKTLSVTVGKRKERSMAFFSSAPGSDHNFLVWSGRASYGLELTTLSEQLGTYFGVPGGEGVLVESVKKDGPASKAGFQAGDVITKVGKEKVAKSVEVLKELSDYEEGDKVDFEVYRKGSRKTLTLDVEEADEDGRGFFFREFGDHDGVVVAPRIRMNMIPGPDMNIHIDGLRKDALEDAREQLRESLESLREKEIHIKKLAPVIETLGRRITI